MSYSYQTHATFMALSWRFHGTFMSLSCHFHFKPEHGSPDSFMNFPGTFPFGYVWICHESDMKVP